MKNRKLILGGWLLFACLPFDQARACTAFVVHSPTGPVLARNYDFPAGEAFLARNARGVAKTSLPIMGSGHTWVSLYGSITVNQLALEFPSEGMNEAGLSVASLWWQGSAYPTSPTKPSINELQWIQYQLDTFASVQEVVERLDAVPLQNISAPLHYFICDPQQCAIIEWREGKPKAFLGATLPIPALANDGYSESLELFRKHTLGSASAMDQGLLSSDRFSAAARAAASALSVDSLIPSAFATLAKVAQGDFTKWHSLYEPAHRRFQIRRRGGNSTLEISLNTFEWDDKKPGIADLDKAIGNGKLLTTDLQPKVPGKYCSRLISSLSETGLANIPKGLGKQLSDFIAAIHPSTR